jgi:hypothetical protein
MEEAEKRLRSAGCRKIKLQVRETNQEVIQFYARIGYTKDPLVSMGKRFEHDEQASTGHWPEPPGGQ